MKTGNQCQQNRRICRANKEGQEAKTQFRRQGVKMSEPAMFGQNCRQSDYLIGQHRELSSLRVAKDLRDDS
jgi:hypothetical protein